MSDFFIAVRDTLVFFLATGWLDAAWWQILVYVLVTTHITIVSVTIYLHRHQAHRALTLHPFVAHCFRFWLWITTGMLTGEWVAAHRKHHAKCETADDPHSPVVFGIKTVLFRGADLYREAVRQMYVTQVLEGDQWVHEIDHYSRWTPDDWIERHLYSRFTWQGVGLMLVIDVFLFGVIGITVWAIQMLWIPVMAAGIINGAGHFWGYRNFAPTAANYSTNLCPWGIVIGGEELHNNHHRYPVSARFSVKPGEFDIGWLYIQTLERLGLATVRKEGLPPLA